jgi:hypothetical protein
MSAVSELRAWRFPAGRVAEAEAEDAGVVEAAPVAPAFSLLGSAGAATGATGGVGPLISGCSSASVNTACEPAVYHIDMRSKQASGRSNVRDDTAFMLVDAVVLLAAPRSSACPPAIMMDNERGYSSISIS